MAASRLKSSTRRRELRQLEKAPTGITGFDELTLGGLPRGRTSLVCGAAGCGKSLFGMHFLVLGAQKYHEPGVFVAFEEQESDLIENVASLGFDLPAMIRNKQIALDHIHVERSQIEENGEYDLEGLFLRLELAIDSIGAKRVVIDTLETVFGTLTNAAVVRSELRRLFGWLKDKGVTTIITAERGDGALTRHGLEEYVSDCVIVLDHRVSEQISTRRVRVVKYRGSTHGTNEYPFLIDSTGISVVPITSSLLEHKVYSDRVPSGVPQLDSMLGGGGYFKGSTVLVTGTAGSGKSSLAASLADSTCRAGQRCLYVSYEESGAQIQRNMASIGLDLNRWVQKDQLRVLSLRPTGHGLEGHLTLMYQIVSEFEPEVVILDPIGTMVGAGIEHDAHLMVVRLVDFLKSRGVTALLTNLTSGSEALEQTNIAISSLVDTWILVKAIELNGERNRGVYILKSRGMAHSNQIREFVLTSQGIKLLEPYVGPEGVLTGTARVNREASERAAQAKRAQEAERAQRLLERRRVAVEQQIATLRAELAAEASELGHVLEEGRNFELDLLKNADTMRRMRGGANGGSTSRANGKPAKIASKGSTKERQP